VGIGKKQLSRIPSPVGLLRFCGRRGHFRNRAHLAPTEIRCCSFAVRADSLRFHSSLASCRGQSDHSGSHRNFFAALVDVANPPLTEVKHGSGTAGKEHIPPG